MAVAAGLWVLRDRISFGVADRPLNLPCSVGILGKGAEIGDAFEKADSTNTILYIWTPTAGAAQVIFSIILELDSGKIVSTLVALVFFGWHALCRCGFKISPGARSSN